MALGIYISVPFCRTKCSYCNFASGVFSRAVYARYVERVCEDIRDAERTASDMGGQFEPTVDSIYLGGGTPTVLASAELERIFDHLRNGFDVLPETEITVECAPGTLNEGALQILVRCGVNRVSLGVQSMMDEEAAAVGRLHKRATVLEDIARLRAAGIPNINIDLIAGLPHQTAQSWEQSLDAVIATQVPHLSVYMLEVDEDSRLGRELMAGGTRYHAHFVPDDDATADFYLRACERLDEAGVQQYEISNFARGSAESRHNLKYWTRQPYLGFGIDAHSMLETNQGGVRFSTPDALEQYVAGGALTCTPLSIPAAREEAFFLGLRLNRGLDLREVELQFGVDPGTELVICELIDEGLLQREGNSIRLTSRGRLLSNEVFERFLSGDPVLHDR